MATSKFRMPKDGKLYISHIRERCESCIDAGIWNGITRERLRTWLNQFEDGPERYFASCILDAIIYRSDAQTVALMEQLFQRSLPDLVRTDGLILGMEEDWLEKLASKTDDPGIRIVPVLRAGDPPTKSGPLVARMYKQDLRLNERWIIFPDKINEARVGGVRAFLFIDDFLGTGSQFLRFAKDRSISEITSGCTAIYAPLAAHESGLHRLGSEAKWLHVCCVERLSRDYSLFSKSSRFFNDGENTMAAVRSFYFELLRKKGLKVPRRYTAGYGKLATTYVFEHAVPNNNIPLLWYDEQWEPLFRR